MNTDIPHTTEGDIECSCKPLILSVEADGSISRIAGGPLEEPVDTGPTELSDSGHPQVPNEVGS